MYREHEIQKNCVRWFRLSHPGLSLNLVAVPNGGRRTRWEAAQLKEEGMIAGVADLLLFVPSGAFHGLCIEMKQEITTVTATGKVHIKRTSQRDTQKAWQKAVEGQGYKYAVCRSFDEFRDTITNYLKESRL